MKFISKISSIVVILVLITFNTTNQSLIDPPVTGYNYNFSGDAGNSAYNYNGTNKWKSVPLANSNEAARDTMIMKGYQELVTLQNDPSFDVLQCSDILRLMDENPECHVALYPDIGANYKDENPFDLNIFKLREN